MQTIQAIQVNMVQHLWDELLIVYRSSETLFDRHRSTGAGAVLDAHLLCRAAVNPVIIQQQDCCADKGQPDYDNDKMSP